MICVVGCTHTCCPVPSLVRLADVQAPVKGHTPVFELHFTVAARFGQITVKPNCFLHIILIRLLLAYCIQTQVLG